MIRYARRRKIEIKGLCRDARKVKSIIKTTDGVNYKLAKGCRIKMTKAKLKPCPFCGKQKGDAVGTAYAAYVVCDHCEAQGPYIKKGEEYILETMKQAEHAWQSRSK